MKPISKLFDFHERVVVVTGGSRGIGAGIARRFGEAGASVVVGYRENESAAAEVVRSIETSNGRAIAVGADVSTRAGATSLMKRSMSEFGQVDVLVNNAGIYPVTPLLDMTDEDWSAVIDVNLRSVFLCTQEVARHMARGAIINITSIEAESPAFGHSHYNAAKGGVLLYTKASAFELASKKIRVNAVAPGLIEQEGIRSAWPDGVARYERAAPLGRMGQAHEVADACLFLASSGAAFITGTSLVVDGGVSSTPCF